MVRCIAYGYINHEDYKSEQGRLTRMRILKELTVSSRTDDGV